MNSGNHEIEVDGIRLRKGTSLFDTEYGRVLWITDIDEASVTVEPVTDYEVDDPTGWPPGTQTNVIAEGTVFSIQDLKSLIAEGRFKPSL